MKIIKSLDTEYFTAKQLRGILDTKSTAERQILAQVLDELQADNEILFDGRNRRFRLIREEDFGKAVFEGNARGFGFLVRDDGDDLFVPCPRLTARFTRIPYCTVGWMALSTKRR